MKTQTLTFKFTLLFASFMIVTLIISTTLSYLNQMYIYKNQREKLNQYVGSYLEELIQEDSENFLCYHDYFMSNYKNLLIPHDFDSKDVIKSKNLFETEFAKQFPGKTFSKDIKFDQLSAHLKELFTIYNHEKFLLQFEKARENFELIYTQYMVPPEDGKYELTYVLDCLREEKIVDGKKYIELGITVPQPKEEHKKEWEAWETGKRPAGYDTFDNELGKTYAYYTPVYISGRKLGIIGVEVEIAKVNSAILMATIQQMLMIGSALVLFTFILLYLIRKNYIRKLIILSKSIEEYSLSKNSSIADELYAEVTNSDEISKIMEKFHDLIHELDLYITNLTQTRQDLATTKKKALELNELAIKDSLTGIRNKTAYDQEVKKINWEISDGLSQIGIAMVDLNFLKRINDTYGHDKGNISIILLCKIICNIFEHSPVFRVGGDEFVIILKGHDLNNIEDLITTFHEQMEELRKNTSLEYWEKVSAAIGYAVYNPSLDEDFESVFKRADSEMYKNKKSMKALRQE